MADFDLAFEVVLQHEGTTLYSNPKTGEYSKFGITAGFWGDLSPFGPPTASMISDLTPDSAKDIYRAFWDKHPFGSLTEQTVASKLFDASVNMGIVRAVKLFQRAIKRFVVIEADGILGPLTVEAANALDPGELLEAMKDWQENFYRNLAAARPEHAGDLAAWLKRAAWPETV